MLSDEAKPVSYTLQTAANDCCCTIDGYTTSAQASLTYVWVTLSSKAEAAHLERLDGHSYVLVPHVGIASGVTLLSVRHLSRLGHLATH
jgi:hypothetical protein